MSTERTDPWLPALRPGGDPDRVAITLDGRPDSYREFGEWMRTAGSLLDDPAGINIGHLAVPQQLAAVFAAAAAHRPVRIADPAFPAPAGQVPRDSFLVVGTSGSTTVPRAVIRTAASWTRSFAGYSAVTGISGRDRVLLTGPLHSTLQLFAAVHALAIGASITDDPAAASTAICVPTVLARLLQTPTPALRSVVVAGAPLPESVARHAVSTGLTVIEYYGAAELSFVTARRWPDPHTPFPGVEVQLRDGELWARSEFRALGYLTADGPVPLRVDGQGFASVGDLAGRTPDGGLRIAGRGDAAVTVGGRTVIAEDIEDALIGLADVRDAAVLGRPHPRLGEELVALVVPADGLDLAAVRAAARRVLRGESLPRRWLVASRIPRRSTGKIDRAAVRRVADEMLGD